MPEVLLLELHFSHLPEDKLASFFSNLETSCTCFPSTTCIEVTKFGGTAAGFAKVTKPKPLLRPSFVITTASDNSPKSSKYAFKDAEEGDVDCPGLRGSRPDVVSLDRPPMKYLPGIYCQFCVCLFRGIHTPSHAYLI